jgi:hypothetical protein
MYAKELTPKFADEKNSMLLMRGLKKTVSSTKKIEDRKLGKTDCLNP